MKKNAVYASSLCALAALLAFTACKKSSSSSSSSGSVAGAMGSLTSLAFTNSGTKTSALTVRPRSGGCVTPGTNTLNFTPSTPGSVACPAGDTLYTASGGVDMTINNCTSGGYTFNGALSYQTGSPAYNVCISNTTGLVSMGGDFTLTTTSPLSITGNNLQGQTSCTISLTLAMSESNGAYSGSVTGTACSQTINSSF